MDGILVVVALLQKALIEAATSTQYILRNKAPKRTWMLLFRNMPYFWSTFLEEVETHRSVEAKSFLPPNLPCCLQAALLALEGSESAVQRFRR